MKLRFKELCGELTMELEGRIVIATFTGAIDASLARHFAQAIDRLVAPIKGQNWGYISCSEGVDAATPDAEPLFVQAVGHYFQLGCRSSGFVMSSPIAIKQMDSILKRAGLQDGIQPRLFDSRQAAKSHIASSLAQITGN